MPDPCSPFHVHGRRKNGDGAFVVAVYSIPRCTHVVAVSASPNSECFQAHAFIVALILYHGRDSSFSSRREGGWSQVLLVSRRNVSTSIKDIRKREQIKIVVKVPFAGRRLYRYRREIWRSAPVMVLSIPWDKKGVRNRSLFHSFVPPEGEINRQ